MCAEWFGNVALDSEWEVNMSKATREFFEGLKDGKDAQLGAIEAVKEGVLAVAPGLRNILSDVKAELSRLGTQGQMELASAIFNGNAFVPYGPGQYTPTPEEGKGIHGPAIQEPEPQHEQQEQQKDRGREM